jgi:Mrp family chromosome partitioning ATPase
LPYFPKPGPMMLLSSLAGLGIGIGLAFLFEIMSQATRMNQAAMGQINAPMRSRHPARDMMEDDFEIPELDVPSAQTQEPPVVETLRPTVVHSAPATIALASIPHARTALEARSLLDSLATGGASHDVLGQLSLQLQAMRSQGNLNACAIASVGGACEVATLSLALARNFADNGIKTILVDLEAQRSLLPDLMELPHAPGLTDLLGGSSDFSRAIQRDRLSELQFIRHGQTNGSAELQLPARMETITKTLMGIYDVVVVHTGDASPVMLQLAKGCNTVLLHAPAVRRNDAIAAMGTLKSKGFEQVFLIQVDGVQQAAA